MCVCVCVCVRVLLLHGQRREDNLADPLMLAPTNGSHEIIAQAKLHASLQRGNRSTDGGAPLHGRVCPRLRPFQHGGRGPSYGSPSLHGSTMDKNNPGTSAATRQSINQSTNPSSTMTRHREQSAPCKYCYINMPQTKAQHCKQSSLSPSLLRTMLEHRPTH